MAVPGKTKSTAALLQNRMQFRRSLGLAVAAAAVGAAVAVPTSFADPPPPAPHTAAAAALAFTSQEAEDADTNGKAIGPDQTQGSLASEASGRRAVELSEQGQYVEFTLTDSANAVNLAYNVPDGISGTLAVYVNGTKVESPLPVTSKYSYLDTPDIAGSKTHHFFDDSRLLLGSDLQAGDRVRFQVDADNNASPYTVDVADFEQVAAPATPPEGAVSVTDTGADPTGQQDSAAAFTEAITQAEASGSEVWIPAGEFTIGSPLAVDGVTLRGAGNWHALVRSSHLIDQREAVGGVGLHDFAVLGEVTERVDDSPDNFVNGSLGSGSHVSGLWLQHLKVGLWLTGVNDDLVVEDNRFLDMTADGLNLNGSAEGVQVRNNFLRNTGDDALAMWSLNAANSGSSFIANTIVQPNLANGIALYGGTDLTVRDNVLADTNALGSGIAISNQAFGDPFFPLSGTITVAGNTLIRAGAINPNWQHPMGALRVDAFDSAIEATIDIRDTTLIDSPFSAFEFVSGAGKGLAVTQVAVDGAQVQGAGTVVVQAETPGAARFDNVTATDVGAAGIYNCPSPEGSGEFTVEKGSGNSGWDETWPDCGTWPQPASR